MSSSYNPALVAISIIIASFASYSALDLAGRVTAARGQARAVWLTAGAVAMGLGIWSMHFIGMLAFQVGMPMAYDIPLVLVSALVAILASGLAMFVVSREHLTALRLMGAGVTMGVAIAGMHYIGMAAMRMPATITYDALRVGLSLLIAIVASLSALWLAFTFRDDDTFLGYWRKSGAALVMGLAVAGMHYMGMSAANFVMQDAMGHAPSASFSNGGTIPHGMPLAVAVIIGAVFMFLLSLASAILDRRVRHVARERQRMLALQEEMERQIQQRTADLRIALEAAELASRSKSEFLAQMSHELRTPLNSIIGFANVLHKNKQRNLCPHELEYVSRISANGTQLLVLINSILDLAKIESGKMSVELTAVALGPLVTDVVSQLDGVMRDRPVTLRTDLPDHIAMIESDANKLRQILVNLVGNAAKFTTQGSITVRVVAAPGSGYPERVDVIDTGVGIPPDRMSVIFTPFEQADNSITRQYGGTGLGLAITQSLCELLNLELTVKSTVGAGSTFAVHFPAPLPL